MTIRKAVPSDAGRIVELVEETIEAVYPGFYPRGIVDFFLDHHRSELVERDISKGIVYVSETDSGIIGTVTLNGDRMDRLFVVPSEQGKGYGKELILFSEGKIFSEYRQMFVESALPSVMMYNANGFRTVDYGSRTFRGCTLVFPIMVRMNPHIDRD